MTGLAAFSLAIFALLVAPGPTNALLAASGARLGVTRSLPMLAVVLAAYAVSIGVLTLLVAPQLQASPAAWLAAKLAAALYLLWLGLRLWRTADRPGDERDAPVRAAEMFVATLLNPKGLVIGLVLLPRGPELGPRAVPGVLALTMLGCGLVWILAGHAFAAAAPRLATRRLINRASGGDDAGFRGLFRGLGGVFDAPRSRPVAVEGELRRAVAVGGGRALGDRRLLRLEFDLGDIVAAFRDLAARDRDVVDILVGLGEVDRGASARGRRARPTSSRSFTTSCWMTWACSRMRTSRRSDITTCTDSIRSDGETMTTRARCALLDDVLEALVDVGEDRLRRHEHEGGVVGLADDLVARRRCR